MDDRVHIVQQQSLGQCNTDCLRVVLEVRVVFPGLDRTLEGAIRPSSRLEELGSVLAKATPTRGMKLALLALAWSSFSLRFLTSQALASTTVLVTSRYWLVPPRAGQHQNAISLSFIRARCIPAHQIGLS